MRVLALAAHPDDVELLCAGTLARLNEAGHELWIAHMTVGDKGGQRPPEELARIRGEEAVRAAELIGAAPSAASAAISSSTSARNTARASGRSSPNPDPTSSSRTPSTITTPTIGSRDAWPSARSTARPGPRPSLLYMDCVAAVDFAPDLYSDITATVEVKKEMLRCHASQVEWMASYRATDMEYIIEWMGRWRGLECGVRHAEGFRLDERFEHAQDTCELLGLTRLTTEGAMA